MTEFEHWWTMTPRPLDRLCASVARNLRPDLRTSEIERSLDILAASCPHSDGLDICGWLWDVGFNGTPHDYYDPENSMIDSVLQTRFGIPLSLSVIALEVGRRRGASLQGIGMPGEFLVADSTHPGLYVAPFRAGEPMDLVGVERLFGLIHGPDARFERHYLAPVDTAGLVARMLNNLLAIYRSRRDTAGLGWVLALRGRLTPDRPSDLVAASELAATRGRFDEAADLLDRAADLAEAESAAAADESEAPQEGDPGSDQLRERAQRLRARLN